MIRRLRIALSVALLAWGVSAHGAQWQYGENTDKMTDAVTRHATIKSTNSLALDFPYRGVNHGWITVRSHPQYGTDVMVHIDKGQIVCSVSDCMLQIRVDGGKAARHRFARAADADSTVVFARAPQPLIAQLRAAKSVMVQVPIFRGGDAVLEFALDTPLKWPSASPAKRAK